MGSDPFGFSFLLFLGHVFYYVIKQSSFYTNFRIAEPFNLEYVIRFYKPYKGLSSAIFIMKILVAKHLL